MNRHGRLYAGAGLLAILLVSLMLVGCAKYASEEELKALEEAKQATFAAELKVADLEVEQADLEQLIAERQAELQEVKAERASIRQRLTEQGVELPPLEGEVDVEAVERQPVEAPAAAVVMDEVIDEPMIDSVLEGDQDMLMEEAPFTEDALLDDAPLMDEVLEQEEAPLDETPFIDDVSVEEAPVEDQPVEQLVPVETEVVPEENQLEDDLFDDGGGLDDLDDFDDLEEEDDLDDLFSSAPGGRAVR